MRSVTSGSRTWRLGGAAVLLGLVAAAAHAGEDDFAPLTLGKGKKSEDVEVSASLSQEKAGAPAILAVTVRLPKGSYIYSTTDNSTVKTVIKAEPLVSGMRAIDAEFVPSRDAKKEFDKTVSRDVEKFYDSVTWFRRYQLPADVEPSSVEVSGELEGQYCGKTSCTPIRPAKKFVAKLESGVPVIRLPASLGGPADSPHEAAVPAEPLKAFPFTKTERPLVLKKPGHAELTVTLSPEKPAAGGTATLSVTMKLDDTWHTYSMTKVNGQIAIPTTLEFGPLQGLTEKSGKIRASAAPEKKSINIDGATVTQEEHHGEITWTKDFVVTKEGAATGIGVGGKLQYMNCTGSTCLPPQQYAFAVGLLPADALTQAAALEIGRGGDVANGSDTPEGLMAFLITAVIAGFAALLTPCVFPMVPITVSFFLKQSESKTHRPLSMAILYCLGIMGTFTALGLLMAALFGATSLNELANNPWLNLGIAAVMVFFGFNLLGMFEIRVPYWLLTWTSGHEGKGGVLGVLFMALTFTLVSFTCTFAFCGLLLAWAAKGQYFWPILGMLAFSAAFASPFFFLALFPSFLKKIPKSGGWMNTIKVTMGMIELGAAAKFFSNADLAWNPTEPMLFDFTLTLTIWLVISTLTSIYLLGWFRLPHDTSTESISVPRLLGAMAFLLLAGLLGAGIFSSKEPGGQLWANIKALVPARLKTGIDEHGPFVDHHGLKFTLDYQKAIEIAKTQNKPLFFDFTGVNCPNCRLMEAQMAQPENHALLENFVRVQLYTDAVPGVRKGTEEKRLLEINRAYQSNVFGDATLPAYLIVTPDGKPLENFKGFDADRDRFTAFLDKGLQRWSSQVSEKRKTGTTAISDVRPTPASQMTLSAPAESLR